MMINKNQIIKSIGSPKIFVYTVIWMMILVFFGTIVQKDIGLYRAQEEYFSSWIKFIGPIPIPSGRMAMLIMLVNLSCYFIRPHIFSKSKIGITITHFGVIMMILGGGITAFFSIEGNLVIDEGKKTNFFESYYKKEFAVVNTSDPKEDFFTIFDDPLLRRKQILEHESFPFKLEIIDFYENCRPARRIYKGDNEFRGMAENFFLQQIDSEKEFEKNMPGIIYKVIGSENSDGIYINYLGQPVTQRLENDKKSYYLILRRQRTYLPFSIELIDFKKVMHPGTNIAKSYSSRVNLIDNNISRKVLIQMNEPLRYKGYTFYQASFIEGQETDTSVLATVKNHGRLFPYISTIIMCIGLLIHMLFMVSKKIQKNRLTI